MVNLSTFFSQFSVEGDIFWSQKVGESMEKVYSKKGDFLVENNDKNV
jgi:hypothetical protein